MQYDSYEGTTWFMHKSNLLIRSILQKELNNYDITTEQWSVLNRLYRHEQCNQKDLAKICFKDQAALTRILDILEKKDFVKREKSNNDRREFLLLLTSKGKDLVEKIRPNIQIAREKAFSGLEDKERETLFLLLRKLTESLE